MSDDVGVSTTEIVGGTVEMGRVGLGAVEEGRVEEGRVEEGRVELGITDVGGRDVVSVGSVSVVDSAGVAVLDVGVLVDVTGLAGTATDAAGEHAAANARSASTGYRSRMTVDGRNVNSLVSRRP